MKMQMGFARAGDSVESKATVAKEVDTSPLLGVWVNSNPDSNGIARMVMSQSVGSLTLQVSAIGPDGLIDWGMADVSVFTSASSSRVGAGFACRYDFGFVETRLLGMILKGLIVLAELHSFKDDSERADYFVREYFALDHAKY
jgi:hypothetical protein